MVSLYSPPEQLTTLYIATLLSLLPYCLIHTSVQLSGIQILYYAVVLVNFHPLNTNLPFVCADTALFPPLPLSPSLQQERPGVIRRTDWEAGSV